MIQYLTHRQIDRSRWDDCVAHAINGNVYAWSWYLDVVHPGWEALIEIEDDKYLTIMPITGKKKYLINYLCQPFFVQQLGVFSIQPLTAEKVQSFLEAIPRKYGLVEIRLNEQNPLPETFSGVEYHRNYLLDLNHDYEFLSSNYHENTKRNLKKSLNYGLQLVSVGDVQQTIDLFRADRGATVSHWGDAEYQRLNHLAALAITSSNAFVYGIQKIDNQEIICSALFMESHRRITFLFSGNSAVGKQSHAMTFLIDQVIRERAGKDFVFDFEGSDNEALARFYHGFGASPVDYPGYRRYSCSLFRSKKNR